MGDSDTAAETTRLVVDALRRSGQRGILATGWSGMARIEKLPEDMFVLESAPHVWLFPRVSAVVHHGGAGTPALKPAVVVPSVVVRNAVDQFAYGRRVFELGVGPEPPSRKRSSPRRGSPGQLLRL